jgi:predicted glycoside hydrolase/deacetylase ChbG (UPF0249 family)
MNQSKKLIINADDFGASRGVDRGIICAHKKGILTSTSILGNLKNTAKIKKALDGCRRLGKGVHINLTFGQSLSGEISGLTDYTGRFNNNPYSIALKISYGFISTKEVKEEISSQIENIKDFCAVDHIDSHQHIHITPSIYPMIERLAKKYGVKFVRIPYQNINPLFFSRISERVLLNSLSMKMRLSCNNSDYASKIKHFSGFFRGGLNKAVFLNIINNTKKGACELMCHPAFREKSRYFAPGLSEERFNDLRFLVSKQAKIICSKEVELIKFNDLN